MRKAPFGGRWTFRPFSKFGEPPASFGRMLVGLFVAAGGRQNHGCSSFGENPEKNLSPSFRKYEACLSWDPFGGPAGALPVFRLRRGGASIRASCRVPRACVSMLLQFHGARKHGGKIKALLKRSCFLTKPLILGIGASKVLPSQKGRAGTNNNKTYRKQSDFDTVLQLASAIAPRTQKYYMYVFRQDVFCLKGGEQGQTTTKRNKSNRTLICFKLVSAIAPRTPKYYMYVFRQDARNRSASVFTCVFVVSCFGSRSGFRAAW